MEPNFWYLIANKSPDMLWFRNEFPICFTLLEKICDLSDYWLQVLSVKDSMKQSNVVRFWDLHLISVALISMDFSATHTALIFTEILLTEN